MRSQSDVALTLGLLPEEKRDWRELCAAVAKEEDQSKLLDLMEELLAVLEHRESNSGEHSVTTTANHKSHRAGRTSHAPRTAPKRSGIIAFPVK